ncbi:MAG: hypothetical protein NZ455_03120 [Bacteroidia bacterium]|nr:hypothetical protein [Bacteroidia bacterium]
MRRACGSTVRSPSPALLPLPRGWAGGAQHRQPVARRPCLHERSETQARTRPKKINYKHPVRPPSTGMFIPVM